MKLFYFLISGLFLSGCGHYFTKSQHVEVFYQKDNELPYCIVDKNEAILRPDLLFPDGVQSTEFTNSVIKKIKKKYVSLSFDCDKPSKYLVSFIRKTENVDKSYVASTVLSLGIFPTFIDTKYQLSIFDPDKNIVYQVNEDGTGVISIFMVPLAPWARFDDEIAAEMFIGYLEKQRGT